MNDATTPSAKPIHHYTARCTWSGSTGVGYEKYDRAHVVGAPPAAAALAVSADPAFRGNPTLLNPEQLLVMAASSCQLLSFLALAARARVDVVAYEDQAEAEMPEADRPVRITTIRLRPRITVAVENSGAQGNEPRLRRLVEQAHHECYIATSLRTEITVEPAFEWR